MRVTDTLSGKKETFTPGGDTVKMYVCGVTPYDESHIGHAMSYIIFDVIRRYLRYRGHQVKYVQNVTDIDDKIIERAARLGTTTSALAEKFTRSYQEDMAALNVEPPDFNPRATGEVAKIREIIEGLVAKGYAYPAGGSVYFRVRNSPDYGKLSHRTLDSMMAGARIEPGEEKEHPMDFVLWKAARPGEPSWDSPWGQGRPGWHIECSAMALKYLGESIDIHGGGQDLIFPHHENEIAQSESFTGVKPFARYWLHNGLLQVGDSKMSKSTGNLISIKEILARHSADTLRLFVLSSTYRSPLTFSEEGLEAAGRGAERLIQTAGRSGGNGKSLDVLAYRKQFLEAMDDDFNSARALSSLFDMARAINQAADSKQDIDDALKTFKELAQNVLGLTLKATEKQIGDASPFIALGNSLIAEIRETNSGLADELQKSYPADGDGGQYINWLICARAKLRAAKQFQTADEIRKKLLELGVTLEDTPQGTVWKYRK
ncbi:MAG: cysteine--tRNA ligase [Dehalococcoidia bacterium]|nr:MAG: cysteine--tRNA ligase [Dehalococcoidia bacterium]